MTKEEYSRQAEILSNKPHKTETPKEQKFNIGDIVKIVSPSSWFARDKYIKDKERTYQIQYSYFQKYGGTMKHHYNSYSLKHLFEDNSSSWYGGEELEIIK